MRGAAAPLPAEALGFTPVSPSRLSSENSASSPAGACAAGSASGAGAFANRCPGFFAAGAATASATGAAPAARVPPACDPTGAAWLGAGASSPTLSGAPQNGQLRAPSSTVWPQNGQYACLEPIDHSFPIKTAPRPAVGQGAVKLTDAQASCAELSSPRSPCAS